MLNSRLAEGKKVLVEGANAAMLDIDFGEVRLKVLILTHLFPQEHTPTLPPLTAALEGSVLV